MSKTFSVRSNAVRNARIQLGKSAKQDVHFTVGGEKGAYTWTPVDGAPVAMYVAAEVTETPKAHVIEAVASKPVKVKKARITKAVTKYLKDGASGKRAKLIRLITSDKGASLDTITKALGWQKHTVRGAISTALSDGLIKDLKSERHERRGRVYHAKAA